MTTTSNTMQSRYLSTLKTILSLIPNPFNNTTSKTIYDAPIYCLPVELLEKIFFLSLLNYSGDWGFRGPPVSRKFPKTSLSPGASSDPMVLAQVCMLWRAISLSTPMLWSSVSIHCTRKGPKDPLLEVWLERSGSMPLTIVFVESIHGFEKKVNEIWGITQNPFTSNVMTFLMTHSHRWKAIDFSFSRRIPSALLDLQPGSVPILESAAISSRYAMNLFFGGLPPLEKVWDALHSSPSLKSGRWEIDYLESNLTAIPWTQLVSIDVMMTIESLFEVLPHCKNLTTLRFVDPYARVNPDHFPPSTQRDRLSLTDMPITLSHLRDLRLVTARSPDAVFDRLVLPSLVSVSVEQKRIWLDQPDPSRFIGLLLRSGCCLEEYAYNVSGDSELSENILLDILASPAMSALKYLSIEPGVTKRFTSALTWGEDSAILPCLEKLSIQWCKAPPIALSKMIQSRRVEGGYSVRFRDLQVKHWEKSGPQDIDFGIFRQEGMTMDLPQ